MANQLEQEASRATEMLEGKVVRCLRRQRAGEVQIEFVDGTRLFVDQRAEKLELSITEENKEKRCPI